jgi:iron-sulfur cluster assembly protein
MLALTPTALEIVRSITAAPGTSGAGLRIAAAAEEPRDGVLELTVSPGPVADDQVVAGSGAQVFLDPPAAAYLDDKVLDAEVDNDGNARFFLAEQAAGTGD